MSKVKVNSVLLDVEKDDESTSVNVTVSYTNENIESLDFTEINAVIKRTDGIFIAESNSTISREIPSESKVEESVGFYGFNEEQIPKNRKDLVVEATIKLGKYHKFSEFESEIDDENNEKIITFRTAGDKPLKIIGGSVRISEPDEDKFVNVDMVICVQNNSDKYYPELNISYEIIDLKENFLDGSDGISELKPNSIVYFTQSMYIKKNKLKKAKLHGSVKFAEYIEMAYFTNRE